MGFVMVDNSLTCVLGTATRTSPATITPTISGSSGSWTCDINPIQLENDFDEIHWDLSKVIGYYTNRGEGVEYVEIEFTNGPTGFDTLTGPFINKLYGSPYFMGLSRKSALGDFGCYTYKLWVKLVKFVDLVSVFPTDPQIDNLPPPKPGG